MPNELKRYKVLRAGFESLEIFLNEAEEVYEEYDIVQVVPEHSYDGAFANIIMRLKEAYDNDR